MYRRGSRYIRASEGVDYSVIPCNENDLEELYNGSALTFEGCAANDDNIGFLMKWFEDHNCTMTNPTFYEVSGALMNDYYGLTGDNAYPRENCTLLCIKLDDLSNWQAIVVPRFQIGGRWFDDIVENNLSREGR